MRGVFFCSIAFAVNTAVASVCKPRPRSSDTSTLLHPTSATQDVTTTTLLAVPPASTSAPVFSDAASTSLSEGIATTTDLSLSVTIDTTSEKTGVAIETTSSVDNVETPTLIDTATTGLPTTTANTLTTELSFTTLKEALSTEASIDVDTTITIRVTTTEGEVTPTSVTIISADATTATTLEEAVSSEAATANLTPTTLEATTILDTTTTEVSTADETTATAEAATTTSQDPWQPLPTFDLVSIGSPLSNSNGERLSKWDMTWEVIGWKSNEPALHMAIDPETSYLRESGSSYICVLVDRTEPEYHNRIVKCDVELLDMPIVRHLTCGQKSDGKLACSAPAVSCILSEATWEFECEDLEGEFDRFYTVSDGSVDLLAFGSERYPPPGTEVHPIELGVIAPRSEL